MLSRQGQPLTLRQWATQLLGEIEYSAAILDHSHHTTDYSDALSAQAAKVIDPELTPSARILRLMRENNLPFCKFGMQASEMISQHFAKSTMSADKQHHFTAASAQSLAAQAAIEAQDSLSFDEFLRQWNDYRL